MQIPHSFKASLSNLYHSKDQLTFRGLPQRPNRFHQKPPVVQHSTAYVQRQLVAYRLYAKSQATLKLGKSQKQCQTRFRHPRSASIQKRQRESESNLQSKRKFPQQNLYVSQGNSQKLNDGSKFVPGRPQTALRFKRSLSAKNVNNYPKMRQLFEAKSRYEEEIQRKKTNEIEASCLSAKLNEAALGKVRRTEQAKGKRTIIVCEEGILVEK